MMVFTPFRGGTGRPHGTDFLRRELLSVCILNPILWLTPYMGLLG